MYGSLDNYISLHRRRACLSQNELAVLIGIENRATITYYEQGVRVPPLSAAVALEIVFGCQIQDLFAGVAEHTREDVARRAAILLECTGDRPTKENAIRLDTLTKLAHYDEERIIPIWEDAA